MATTIRTKAPATAPRQVIEVYGVQVNFPFGEVLRVRSIAEYTIVEYARYVVRDVVADESPRFRAYVKTKMVCDAEGGEGEGVTYYSVDDALVAAIAFKYQGASSEAPLYFMRMIGAAADI